MMVSFAPSYEGILDFRQLWTPRRYYTTTTTTTNYYYYYHYYYYYYRMGGLTQE